MSELFMAVLGFTTGLLISWQATNIYYRQLIQQLIERNRAIVADMRREQEANQRSNSVA